MNLVISWVLVAAALLGCAQSHAPKRSVESSTFAAQVMWQVIFPGTKWCGNGDIAKDDDDLGIFKETDMCCRTHDKCFDVIDAGKSKYNLTNDSPYTKLHCDCDGAFYECLKLANKPISGIVGTTYFNVLGGKCYELNHPATCSKFQSIIGMRKRCVEYAFDTEQQKVWQWFDVPRYTD